MKRRENTKKSAYNKGCTGLFIMICLLCLVACQNVDNTQSSENNDIVQPTDTPESYDDVGRNITVDNSSDAPDIIDDQTMPSGSNSTGNEVSDNSMLQEGTHSEESEQNGYTIEGFDFVDGMEKPVCVTLSVESIHRGEEAYGILQGYHSDITPPNENEEYIIVTFNVSYDSGEIEELYMMENRASLEQAGLYFALSNSQSNAYDVTSYLSNNIYDIILTKGQSTQGAVAFLQEKGNTEPLIFIGFEQIVRFDIN